MHFSFSKECAGSQEATLVYFMNSHKRLSYLYYKHFYLAANSVLSALLHWTSKTLLRYFQKKIHNIEH